MGIDFDSLLPATTQAAVEAARTHTSRAPKQSNRSLIDLRRKTRSRLIAQEYVRNGMNLRKAIQTVSGNKTLCNSASVLSLLGAGTDAFIDELSKIVDKSQVDKNRALNILWAMVNASILDFVDDNGDVLPIAELRKLPRVMQIMISKIEVHSTQRVVKENGKVVYDDNGSPYVTVERRVKIAIPERMEAIAQLAQMMKWVGPTTLIQNTVNIHQAMSDADSRVARARVIYDQPQLDHDSDQGA